MNFHHLCSCSFQPFSHPPSLFLLVIFSGALVSVFYTQRCVCVCVMDLFMCVPFCPSACFADFVEGFVCVFLLDLSVSLLSLTLSKSVCVYLHVPSVSQPVLLTSSKGLCVYMYLCVPFCQSACFADFVEGFVCVHVSVCSLLSVSLFR